MISIIFKITNCDIVISIMLMSHNDLHNPTLSLLENSLENIFKKCVLINYKNVFKKYIKKVVYLCGHYQFKPIKLYLHLLVYYDIKPFYKLSKAVPADDIFFLCLFGPQFWVKFSLQDCTSKTLIITF